MTDNSKDNTIKVLVVIVAGLVGIIGAMAGHISTKQEIASEIASFRASVEPQFVPRRELDSRLNNIQSALARIERSMENHTRGHDGK